MTYLSQDRSRPARSLLLPAFLALAILAIPGCSGLETARRPVDRDRGPVELDGVEVTEYRGEDLSSVQDFRENSIKGPQDVDVDSYTLSIDGLVDTPLELTYDEVIEEHDSYEKVVTLDCVEGWSVDILWEGVLVEDLLDEAGVDPDANTVIMHAVDGYSSSLPLDFYDDREILLAYKMNGVVLPAERGFPFQLVAEDKWGYKWVKWIDRIELSDDEDYRGYWESRGYSNKGDAGGQVFGD